MSTHDRDAGRAQAVGAFTFLAVRRRITEQQAAEVLRLAKEAVERARRGPAPVGTRLPGYSRGIGKPSN